MVYLKLLFYQAEIGKLKSENGKLILVSTFDYALLKLSFPLSLLTALRALEPALARCKSSSKLGFCSLNRSFQFVLYHEAYII